MKLSGCLLWGMALVALGAASSAAFGEKTGYPARPIRLIVPIAAGGGVDILARALAQKLGESLRQAIVVDNRAGAGGLVGAGMMVRAEPDGYTLGVVSGSFATNAATYKLTYDAVNDVTLICLIGESGYLITLPISTPINNVKELIAHAKANPGKLNYGSSGYGGSTHLATELFELMAGVKMTHVPYKGGGPAATAMLAGEVQVLFGSMAATLPQLRGGRVRSIAITTPRRSNLLPDVPTVAESGVPGYEALIWYGVLGPKRMPTEITGRWNREITKILQSPEMKERMAPEGLDIPETAPEYFRKVLKRDIANWTRVVKEAKIQIQVAE